MAGAYSTIILQYYIMISCGTMAHIREQKIIIIQLVMISAEIFVLLSFIATAGAIECIIYTL